MCLSPQKCTSDAKRKMQSVGRCNGTQDAHQAGAQPQRNSKPPCHASARDATLRRHQRRNCTNRLGPGGTRRLDERREGRGGGCSHQPTIRQSLHRVAGTGMFVQRVVEGAAPGRGGAQQCLFLLSRLGHVRPHTFMTMAILFLLAAEARSANSGLPHIVMPILRSMHIDMSAILGLRCRTGTDSQVSLGRQVA